MKFIIILEGGSETKHLRSNRLIFLTPVGKDGYKIISKKNSIYELRRKKAFFESTDWSVFIKKLQSRMFKANCFSERPVMYFFQVSDDVARLYSLRTQ